MDIEAFEASPIGDLVPIRGYDHRLGQPYDHFAYVPHNLPHSVALTQPTINLMGQADRALGALTARIRLLPNPDLLVRPALRKEAQDTSALEGTYAHLDDILKDEYVDPPKRSTEVREVLNYVAAAMMAIEMVKTLPISQRLLNPIQAQLVKNTRGDGYDAGRLRERQVHIGEESRPIEEARFVPPPPGEPLISGFAAWETWINTADDLPLIAKLAMSHYQFETLHPYSDGNGRLGRLLVTLQLMAAGELEYPILNLSSWFEPRRDDYLEALRRVSLTGDLDGWIATFSTAVRDRARAALNTIDALLSYRDSVVARATAEGLKVINNEVADVVIGNPVVTIQEFSERCGVVYNTGKSYLEKLVRLDVYREITGSEYGRIFFCEAVARIVDRG